ncbi:hypothetical protein D3C77_34370 [compost metagenome]
MPEYLKTVLAVLWAVKRGDRTMPNEGLCSNVTAALPEQVDDWWDRKVGRLHAEWPECSKDDFGGVDWVYPVPGRRDAYRWNKQCGTMWTGEYGSARIRLLNYLIRRVEAELKELEG